MSDQQELFDSIKEMQQDIFDIQQKIDRYESIFSTNHSKPNSDFHKIKIDLLGLSYFDVLLLMEGIRSIAKHDITKSLQNTWGFLDNRSPIDKLLDVANLHTKLDVARKISYTEYNENKAKLDA